MQTAHLPDKPTTWMAAVGVIAIVFGGTLSAFMAHNPSRLAMWASAYLVLVVGLAQMMFGSSLGKLSKPSHNTSLWISLALYNLANIAVTLGRIYKGNTSGPVLIVMGAVGLITSVIIMLWSTRGAARSARLISLYIVALVIIISAPVGVILSHI